MTRPRCTAALAAALAAAMLSAVPLSASAAPARTAASATRAQLLAVEGFWLSVSNLERSLAFYRTVVGLSAQPSATAIVPGPALRSLTAMPNVQVRSATLRSGNGPALRLLEFPAVPRRVLHPHSVDPGAAMLEVSVTDLAASLAAAARLHVTVVTRGGAPLLLPDGSRRIVLMDPDGFFVALSQPAQPVPTVRALGMRYTVAAPATMVRFYRQLFGITLHAENFGSPGPWAQLLDQGNAQWAITRTGATAALTDGEDLREVQFVAFRRVPRHTFLGRPQDPGTPMLSLRVTHLTEALRAIRSAGLRVLSAGGQPVPLAAGGAAVLFRDPAGVLVALVQR